ncbi:MAG: hypothetical protein ACR2QM_00855 [Longimicrobiales bacterium]
MKRQDRTLRIALGVAAVITALTTVAWRQSAARETMEQLADLERELTLAVDERELLARDLMVKEGRVWVGEQAAARLQMRAPSEHEVQFLPGVAP